MCGAASSSSLVRPCISNGSSERSSRVIAESCSCSAADFAPASPLRREYSSRCRLFISTSPRDSASCCSAVARASASETSASCFSSPFCCLVAALCASSTLSSDLACAAREGVMEGVMGGCGGGCDGGSDGRVGLRGAPPVDVPDLLAQLDRAGVLLLNLDSTLHNSEADFRNRVAGVHASRPSAAGRRAAARGRPRAAPAARAPSVVNQRVLS